MASPWPNTSNELRVQDYRTHTRVRSPDSRVALRNQWCKACTVSTRHAVRRRSGVAYQHVFAPLTMRGVRLRNRIVMTAHRKGLDMPYSPGPRELAYLAAR